jgi:hypothetical protein
LRSIAILLVRFQRLDEFHHSADLVADVHDSLRCDVIAERLESESTAVTRPMDARVVEEVIHRPELPGEKYAEFIDDVIVGQLDEIFGVSSDAVRRSPEIRAD